MKSRFFAVCAILSVASASFFTSCTEKVPSLAETAISEHISKTMGEVSDIKFLNLTKIDSTTLDREISIRKAIFKTKLQQDELYLAKYTAARVKDKIAEKEAAIAADKKHIAQMDSIKTAIGSGIKGVAYYDYCFSVKGKANGEKFLAENWYVCMTPDGTVINFVQDKDNLHKGAGVSIPGYAEIFGDKDEENAMISR